MFKESKFLSWLVVLLLAVLVWVGFAPVQIGGPVAYVMLSGNSMEPDYTVGDLILARKDPAPAIGEAVVYQHPQVGYVFHRIIDRQGDTFLLQGDNNGWVDSYQPSGDQVIGSYWLHLPGGGSLISSLRKPVYFALLSLGAAGLVLSLVFFRGKDLKQNKRQKRMTKTDRQSQPVFKDYRQDLLLFLGVLGLAALVLLVIAFARPLKIEVSDDLQYTHRSELDYSARDVSGVYDSSQIQTGQPIYLQLTCQVALDLDYRFSAPQLTPAEQTQFQGSYRINALVQDADGWQRSLPLQTQETFTGAGFNTQTSLNACQIRDLILEKEQKTGTSNRWYFLTIAPEVSFQGVLQNKPLEGITRPEFTFQIDESLMRLPDGGEDLIFLEEGNLENTQVVRNSLQIFGMQIPVRGARWASMSLLAASLLVSIWPLSSLYRDWKTSDVSRIQVQYHPMLVDVKMGSPGKNAQQIVEVASFEDLSRMAERYGAMILHESRGNFHRYSIQDEQTVYQYTLDSIKEHSYFADLRDFEEALKSAVEEDQFELYYQPIVLLENKQVVGIEAFLRWNHPRLGMIYPAEFIHLAEENGFVPQIDGWVIEQGCRQLQEWQQFGLPLVPLSINISPNTILSDPFARQITKTILKGGCDPHYLQLEINRSNQVFRDQRIQQRLLELREMGVRLAIDNFATDAANQIDQVSKMPIQSLKIDRSIMKDISKDHNNLRLINAVVKMARSLQIEVVAQGVESLEQIAMLEEQEILLAQGYLLGDPVPAREMGWKLGKKTSAGDGSAGKGTP